MPSFVKEYSLAIINAVESRFPESELYFSFKIFDPKELPDNERNLFIYGTIEIEFLDKFYGEDKYVDDCQFCGIIEKGELIKEWYSVKFYLQFYKNTELEFIQLWKYILDNDETFSFNYPITTIILKIALIIPLSNAHVERIFSQQNLIYIIKFITNKIHIYYYFLLIKFTIKIYLFLFSPTLTFPLVGHS